MVNQLLPKRVLPAYLGFKGLQFLDHKLGHKLSQMLAALPLKAQVVRAELTDKLPFARRITGFYANVVPGGQYGALERLPAACSSTVPARHPLEA